MAKSVEKLGRWRLLHKWLDASSRYADKLAFPASKHYFNNVFLSPWEKQIRKFFEENKRKKWRIIEHYLAGLLDSPSMRRHYRRVCNSGRRDQPKTIC